MSLFGSYFSTLFGGKRPPFEGAYIYIFSMIVGYAAADLTITKFRPEMLPTEAPPAKPVKSSPVGNSDRGYYQTIIDKNMFNADGKIPPPKAKEGEEEAEEGDFHGGPAVLSQLPLELLGTIVHFNPRKSVTTILAKNRNETSSYMVGEQIPGVAEITKIERRKVTFKNLNNNRMEYIEIPDDMKITFGVETKTPTGKKSDEVTQTGKFEFEMNRDDVDRLTADMSSLLTQARMLPNMVNGQVEGYRFVSIKPDSIFAKLGFKEGDVIKNVNGEPVNSPTKAMELYNAMKTSDRLSLGVNRDGRDEDFSYSIK